MGRLLYLGPAQPAHQGVYTCECSNVAGNSSQALQLEVHGERAGGPEPGGRSWGGGSAPPESTRGQEW